MKALSWQHPEEIEELKNLVGSMMHCQMENFSLIKMKASSFHFLPIFLKRTGDQIEDEYSSLPINETGPVLETNYTSPLEELKANYKTAKQKKPIWKKRMFPSTMPQPWLLFLLVLC